MPPKKKVGKSSLKKKETAFHTSHTGGGARLKRFHTFHAVKIHPNIPDTRNATGKTSRKPKTYRSKRCSVRQKPFYQLSH